MVDLCDFVAGVIRILNRNSCACILGSHLKRFQSELVDVRRHISSLLEFSFKSSFLLYPIVDLVLGLNHCFVESTFTHGSIPIGFRGIILDVDGGF